LVKREIPVHSFYHSM